LNAFADRPISRDIEVVERRDRSIRCVAKWPADDRVRRIRVETYAAHVAPLNRKIEVPRRSPCRPEFMPPLRHRRAAEYAVQPRALDREGPGNVVARCNRRRKRCVIEASCPRADEIEAQAAIIAHSPIAEIGV